MHQNRFAVAGAARYHSVDDIAQTPRRVIDGRQISDRANAYETKRDIVDRFQMGHVESLGPAGHFVFEQLDMMSDVLHTLLTEMTQILIRLGNTLLQCTPLA